MNVVPAWDVVASYIHVLFFFFPTFIFHQNSFKVNHSGEDFNRLSDEPNSEILICIIHS